MPTALILDGRTNQALACARSLGRAGYRVLVSSHFRWPLAGWSRYSGEQFHLRSETLQLAADLGCPCVVKPRFSNAWDGTRFLPNKSCAYVSGAEQLHDQVLSRRQDTEWPLLQTLVEGQGKGVFALYDRGRAVAWFAQGARELISLPRRAKAN